MAPDAVAPETRTVVGDFFSAVFNDEPQALIEVRAFPSKARIFVPLAELDRLLQFLAEQAATQDCYFGVAARKDGSSGTLANCQTLGAIFADLDFKLTPEPEARRRLAEFPLPPSLVVHSGHGLHPYWLLREPLDLATDEARARGLLEGLAAALAGDRSAAEPARVLRVPRTWNRKTPATPVRVEVELCEPERRYNPTELEEWLPAVPEASGGNGFHAEASVGVGDRHRYLFRLSRSLKMRGLSPAAVLAAARVENAEHCAPPLPEAEVERQVESAFDQADRPGFGPRPVTCETPEAESTNEDPSQPPADEAPPGGWPLYDGADAWEFPATAELIDSVLPASGVVWWGGLPKRYKSLFALYCFLGIACRRSVVAKKFLIRAFPKILYVSREDGGARLRDRRDDILSAWTERPEPGAIVFVIRPRLDLSNPEHVGWLRETCRSLDITILVLDTWTALSPSADPLGTKDQAQLAAAVVKLCEDIGGLVVVVDHSRKNRPEGQPLSSADIFGPPQKWAAAEHIVMLDVVEAGRRLEVFIEGKDMETRRFFLAVSPRGSGEEKFSFAGSVEELAQAQQAVGTQNREAVLATLRTASVALSTGELVDLLTAAGTPLSRDTVQKHVRGLMQAGTVHQVGTGRETRYFALAEPPGAPSPAEAGAGDE